MAKLEIGANAPNLSLPAIDGSTFEMSDYVGKSDIDVLQIFFVPALQHQNPSNHQAME